MHNILQMFVCREARDSKEYIYWWEMGIKGYTCWEAVKITLSPPFSLGLIIIIVINVLQINK